MSHSVLVAIVMARRLDFIDSQGILLSLCPVLDMHESLKASGLLSERLCPPRAALYLLNVLIVRITLEN